MPFPAQWLQALKITLCNTNSANVLGFCSKLQILNIPNDQRHCLDNSDGQKMRPESRLREAARHSDVGACIHPCVVPSLCHEVIPANT